MVIQILKCPNCGAGVPASVAGSVAPCAFCGAVLSGLALRAAPTPEPTPAHAPVASPAPRAAPTEPVRPAPRTIVTPLSDDALLDLARRRLGAPESLYFDGAIPSGKLKAARETHGASLGRVLVQYDDTLFGGADDGFALTANALHWKNLMEEPHSLRWSDIDPAAVAADDGAVKVGAQKIDIVLEEGKPMIAALARLISDLAAWARGHGPPND